MLLLVDFALFLTQTATPQTYTLSLHDALPISYGTAGQPDPEFGTKRVVAVFQLDHSASAGGTSLRGETTLPPAFMVKRFGKDRKSTRLNSSHLVISYAVFCLKKKQN